MPKPLNSIRRQKRVLTVPAPPRRGNIKVTAEGWVRCARVLLIEEGIGAIKVDRLARRLKVTRGGFYHHFSSPLKLLAALLEDWRLNNRFIPEAFDVSSPRASLEAFERLTDNIIHELGFDPQFDMAIREWARISQPVADIVRGVDEQRMEMLGRMFAGFGYESAVATVRARVFYWHQIGHYTIGVRESVQDREDKLRSYLEVLGGEKYVRALRSRTRKPQPRRQA